MLTFNPKGGSLGRLPEAGEGVELQVGRQGLDQADGHGALPLAQRGGGDTAPTKKRHCSTQCLVHVELHDAS